jgi:diaminobutyrate-2-oxoglutarate transaminase
MVTRMESARSTSECIDEFEASESAVRSYCRNMPAVFSRAVNARVWDENGVEYIDFLSACGSLNYGHNNPMIKSRVAEYLANDGMINGLDLHTVAKRDFLRAFRETVLAPRKMEYRLQFTGPTGTNTVEAALKLARKVTGRRSVVAFTNAFHGMTLGSLSVTGRIEGRMSAGVALNDVVRLPYDGYRGAGIDELDRYEAMVNDPSGGMEPPAAFIVETIQGEGGLNAARPEWLQHLAKIAKRLGALFIIDDVQAGCGRTGDFFSFESAGLRPDLVCLAKSIGGIGLPMALVLIKPEFDQWSPGEHNGTFRGNNLAFVAATAALQLWRDPDFVRSVPVSAQRIRHWLAQLKAEYGSRAVQLRGRGMMSGLAFSDHSAARRLADAAFRQGLLIETSGPYSEVIKLLPPLTIEQDVLEEGLARLRGALAHVLKNEPLPSAA